MIMSAYDLAFELIRTQNALKDANKKLREYYVSECAADLATETDAQEEARILDALKQADLA